MKKYTEQDYCNFLRKEIREFEEEYADLILGTSNELLRDNYFNDLDRAVYQLYLKAKSRGVSQENLDAIFSHYDF